MLAGEQLADLRQVQHARKELGRDIAVEHPVPVFAEDRRIPHLIIRREPDEPTEQQIVVELFHQLPFRAHRVERLQQQRPQQPLWRDRRPSVSRVKLVEVSRQSVQRFIDQRTDRTQRMIGRDAALQADIAEKNFRSLIFTAHRVPQIKGIRHMHRITLQLPRKTTFSAAC